MSRDPPQKTNLSSLAAVAALAMFVLWLTTLTGPQDSLIAHAAVRMAVSAAPAAHAEG